MNVLAASGDLGLSWILELVALVPIGYLIWKYVWLKGIGPLPGIKQMMEVRAALITSQLEAGAEAERTAADLVESRRATLATARAEAEMITQQSKTAAAAMVEEGAHRADDDYARLLARAEVEIVSALARVRAEIASEASAIIVEAVEAVITAELDGSSHRRLIDEAIAATEAEEA